MFCSFPSPVSQIVLPPKSNKEWSGEIIFKRHQNSHQLIKTIKNLTKQRYTEPTLLNILLCVIHHYGQSHVTCNVSHVTILELVFKNLAKGVYTQLIKKVFHYVARPDKSIQQWSKVAKNHQIIDKHHQNMAMPFPHIILGNLG